jgi:hypothetical protein
MRKIVSFLVVGLLMVGCTGPREATKTPMTLKEAMVQLSDGLNELRIRSEENNQNQPKKFGLVPSKVTAVFTVSVDSTAKGGVNLTVPTTVLTVGGNYSQEMVSKTSNTVTIDFENINLIKYKTLMESLKSGKDCITNKQGQEVIGVYDTVEYKGAVYRQNSRKRKIK